MGLTLDEKLTFVKHINEKIKTAQECWSYQASYMHKNAESLSFSSSSQNVRPNFFYSYYSITQTMTHNYFPVYFGPLFPIRMRISIKYASGK